MSDLFGNLIVGFSTRRLIYIGTRPTALLTVSFIYFYIYFFLSFRVPFLTILRYLGAGVHSCFNTILCNWVIETYLVQQS